MAKSELETFDGLDNRKEVMILLQRLGSDQRRARFIESLIPSSLKGFAECPMRVRGNCGTVAAYHMLVGVCNELGVSINAAAKMLEAEVKRGYPYPDGTGIVIDSAVYRVGREGPKL